MKTAARARIAGLSMGVAVLAGCAYPYPYPGQMQQAYAFDRHPGVALEFWRQYDGYGYGYLTATLVNRSGGDKCAWTEALGPRLLRSGESWQVSQVQSPGAVGIANVLPWDPNCARARELQ